MQDPGSCRTAGENEKVILVQAMPCVVYLIGCQESINMRQEEPSHMQYTKEVEEMVCVAKGPNHGPAPIPEEGKWIQAKEIKDISG